MAARSVLLVLGTAGVSVALTLRAVRRGGGRARSALLAGDGGAEEVMLVFQRLRRLFRSESTGGN